MALLGVNIDHVATLRQLRGTPFPEPVFAAGLCELAGADSITGPFKENKPPLPLGKGKGIKGLPRT